MARKTLNLGILAHVDAGKTTLTERLLYAAGVIDQPGSVDRGTTQTDTLALERQRGITIKAAVVSFELGDATVNLIDTPGHPDFIAEVERVLSVLDGVVLVISAVEGVQPQTRILMRALARLDIPTLFFVNKIDRAGADEQRVLEQIRARLTPAVVQMGAAERLGTREARFTPSGAEDAAYRERLAETLAERDDSLLAAYVEDDDPLSYERLRQALAAQSRQAIVHPVFFGSAKTGAGVDALLAVIPELLPATAGDADGPVAGTVFKIDRGPSGEKAAYVRMFSGTVQTRDRLAFGPNGEQKVTAIRVFERGSAVERPSVAAGQIAKLWGLAEAQIGDRIGDAGAASTSRQFAPPTLETVVVPLNPADAGALRVALGQLAEQDPLIDVRQDGGLHELSISLYGEVQKEVIQETLAADFGLHVAFRETTTICVERPIGHGHATELLRSASNPFLATVGLRVDPALPGAGITFRVQLDARALPLYVYKTPERFIGSMEQYVRDTLEEGLFGWQVLDCAVTMIASDYDAPSTSAADYRKLTPLVLMRALDEAGTAVCEPMVGLRIETPTGALGALLPALVRLGAAGETPTQLGELSVVEAVLPAARLQELRRELPGLTGGEGVLESEFAGYEPVGGEPPTRRRTRPNPLNREEYLLHLARRVASSR